MEAKTGSGKTAAFCVIVWGTIKDIQSGKANKAAVDSLCSP